MATSSYRACPSVPASGRGTVGHAKNSGTRTGTNSGTVSIKALARKVLAQDKYQDMARDSLSRAPAPQPNASRKHTPVSVPDNFSDAVDGFDRAHWNVPEEFEERAAIAEHDGRIPREWSEGLAKLCAMSPPEGLTLHRWEELQNDAGRFCDQWADRADALGWTVLDVFGVEPNVLSTRLSRMGLIWLLRRGVVVAISDESATIRTASGATQRYYRGRTDEGVPIWTLGTGTA